MSVALPGGRSARPARRLGSPYTQAPGVLGARTEAAEERHMMFKRDVLDRVVAGEVSLAFRRWLRPEAKVGGTLRTSVGVIEFGAVDIVAQEDITDEEARKAGFPDRSELLGSLRPGADRRIYRIALHHAGSDPREGLRTATHLTEREIALDAERLALIDSRSKHGPWTETVLTLIAGRPAVPARELAESIDRDLARFKADVRRLKEYGLTESLETGYRLSPRGELVLARLRADGTRPSE
ncbi:hypothetical protein ACFQ61_00565 [Streptomyces sp. NPDC056500]|uniref:hypothetical protein n=1 Tax=Streptomyces sp. NPDC056500 TaxID=3345840 RepID=UPI0036A131F9